MRHDADETGAEARWRASVVKVLKGAKVDSLATTTRDGLRIEPLYPAAGAVAGGPWRDTTRPLHIVQRIDHPDAAEAGTLATADLDGGASGLTLVCAGASSARGFGIAATDVAALLDALPLETVSLRLDLAAQDTGAVGALMEVVRRQGLPPGALDIDIGLDPLGDRARTGGPAGPDAPPPVLDTIAHLQASGLKGPLLRADGRPHHEAGASEAQELAAVLASAVAYLRALEPEGLEEARHAIGFTLVADADQFLTMAKFRALRRLWARIEEACGLIPAPLRLHAETAWRMMARQDAWTNLLRTTIASAAAIMGGADSLTVLPFTCALGLPDAFARRLARNTPLVLVEESHLDAVADPAAGAGGLEALTEGLCAEAWRLFQDLESQGGLGAALAAGRWQADIGVVRAERAAALASGRETRVGVTAFVPKGETPPAVLRPLPPELPVSANALPVWRDAAACEPADTPQAEATA